MNDPATKPSDGVVPKLCGSDVELGNFILEKGRMISIASGAEAASLLLAKVPGHARRAVSTWSSNSYSAYGSSYYSSQSQWNADRAEDAGGYRPYVQDSGRRFLANGGAAYIDLSHLEICTGECRSAFDHLAASRAMLLIARQAMHAANAALPADTSIKVLANNSDGLGNSYGTHLNFLLTRRCFDNIIHRKPHFQQFLGSFQVCSILLTGAGKVGAENGMPSARYQISSRADFIETTRASVATTAYRPLINARDEALNGSGDEKPDNLARLHVIFYDNTLCHTATLLRAGMMQIILAMIEQEQVPAKWLLEEPLRALHAWSRDPGLTARCRLVGRRQFTAVDLLSAIYGKARRFIDAGRADGLVPEVNRIMDLWGECVDRLRQRDMAYLSSRIDWVAKQYLLERAATKHGWDPVRMKFLDHAWSNLDAREGLYWQLEQAGAVEKLVDDATVERSVHEPPCDTRAWLRSWALKNLGDCIDDLDWDMLRLRIEDPADRGWPQYVSLQMPDPLALNQNNCQAILESESNPVEGLRRLLEPAEFTSRALELRTEPSALSPTSADPPQLQRSTP